MKSKVLRYSFNGKVWNHKGKGGWHFITLPKTLSKRIRKNHDLDEEGWGRLKTTAKIGKTEWKTAIWFDSKIRTYLLPVKADVRRKESVLADVNVKVGLALFKQSLW